MKTYSHFIQIFVSFYERQLEQQMFYTANILSAFQPILKWQSSSFRVLQIFLIFMIQMFFSQSQQAPGPNLRNVEKFLVLKCFFSFQTDKVIYIATEPVTPLETYIENNESSKKQNQLAIAWGLHRITVSFLVYLVSLLYS